MTASAVLACMLLCSLPTQLLSAASGLRASAVGMSTAESMPQDDSLVVETLGEPSGRFIDFAPGDYSEWATEITNPTSEPTVVDIAIDAIGVHPLTEDTTSGLDLAADLCEKRLEDSTDADGVDSFDCPSDERRLVEGSASCPGPLLARTVVPAGGTIGVIVTVSLPSSADNRFENTAGRLVVQVELNEGGDPVAGGTRGCSGAPLPSTNPSPPGTGAPTPGGPSDGSAAPRADSSASTSTGPMPGASAPSIWSLGPSTSGLPFTGVDALASLAGAMTTLIVGMFLTGLNRYRRRPPTGSR